MGGLDLPCSGQEQAAKSGAPKLFPPFGASPCAQLDLILWRDGSPTNARGKAAPGSSPARTSSPGTSASTRASNPSAARTVTAASPAPTTWPCTAGGTS
uniref:Uncharacterized protein n=1 Tax=Cyanoderma ruficeps TaxID=181631 RepID=A0A8C3P1P9_9PASS